MKAALIAGCVVLSVHFGASGVHAADALICGQENGTCRPYRDPHEPINPWVEFPKYLWGKWCFNSTVSNDGQEVFFEPDKTDACPKDHSVELQLYPASYEINWGGDTRTVCELTKPPEEKEQLPAMNLYKIHVRCTQTDADEVGKWEEDEDFQHINGLLFIRHPKNMDAQ
jgi:hypothetical protein